MTTAPTNRSCFWAVSALLRNKQGLRAFAAPVLIPFVLLSSFSSTMHAQQIAATGALSGGVIADSISRPVAGAMLAGRFLDTTDIAPYVNSQLATLLTSRVPGVRQVRFGGRTTLASSRGNASLKEVPGGDVTDRQLGAPRACYVQIVIDNITLNQGQVDEPLFNADQINLQAIAAIEFYTVSNRPSEFKRAGGGACGTVVIWTKR